MSQPTVIDGVEYEEREAGLIGQGCDGCAFDADCLFRKTPFACCGRNVIFVRVSK